MGVETVTLLPRCANAAQRRRIKTSTVHKERCIKNEP